MTTITCQIGYGKVNFSNVLVTYASMKVSPPFQKITAVTSGVRAGPQTTIQPGSWNGNGILISTPVAHPPGSVILLQTKWMRGASLVREGALFLRLRVGAPLYSIVAAVPTASENICGDSFQMFSGYCDILNIDELRHIGIQVPGGYASRYMDREELAECYRIIQVSKESIAPPAVSPIATPTGIEMREIAQQPKRRLIIRRKE